MANLKLVADAMFYKKSDWINISDEEKEGCFFIFNRYFSKKYPELSQSLNIKGIDKVSSMNLWFSFMKNKPYPKWFWSKSPNLNKPKVAKKDIDLLLKNLKVKESDIYYLIENNYDFIKEEIKYLNSIQKQKQK
jgi:hypothetical protein